MVESSAALGSLSCRELTTPSPYRRHVTPILLVGSLAVNRDDITVNPINMGDNWNIYFTTDEDEKATVVAYAHRSYGECYIIVDGKSFEIDGRSGHAFDAIVEVGSWRVEAFKDNCDGMDELLSLCEGGKWEEVAQWLFVD